MVKPRLAGVRIRPRKARIFEGPSRDAVIAKTAAILREWTLSPFQHEASCRHSLRRALVLRGHRWPIADLEAESVVSAALAANGARRPTWAQGQPQFTIPYESCQRCGTPLGDDELAAGARFCSKVCASAAKLHSRLWVERAERVAQLRIALALAKDAAPERPCEICGNLFKSVRPDVRTCSPACARLIRDDLSAEKTCEHCGTRFRDSKKARFCSWSCLQASRLAANPERPCAHCGRLFRGHDGNVQYCSNACAAAGLRESLPERQCEVCGVKFQPGKPNAMYCGQRCAARAWYLRKKASA